MPDVLSQPADDVSVARANLPPDRVILTPPICTMGEDAHFTQYDVFATLGNGRHLMMGDHPRMPKMPAQPRLADFFRHRFVPMVANHLLQSASLARKTGLDEKVIIACLLHDIAMAGLITSDHGYWGAQLIEPYILDQGRAARGLLPLYAKLTPTRSAAMIRAPLFAEPCGDRSGWYIADAEMRAPNARRRRTCRTRRIQWSCCRPARGHVWARRCLSQQNHPDPPHSAGFPPFKT